MAPTDISMRWERIAGAVYFVLYLMILTSLVDYVSNTYPIDPGAATWRYGALGILGQFLPTPLFAVALILLLASALYQRGHVRFVAVFSAVMALALVLGMVSFTLDAVQVRADVPMDQKGLFDFAVARSLFKLFTSAAAFALCALAGRRVLAVMAEREPRPKEGKPLVVGS